MTREEIINGLKFTVEMFLINPNTGETYTEPRNDMDKTTIDTCKGAIELLEQDTCEDAVSRKEVFETSGELLGVWGRKALMELPPVTPARKKGKWKTDGYGHIVCTACNEVNVDIWKSRFCPMCGAEMETKDGN